MRLVERGAVPLSEPGRVKTVSQIVCPVTVTLSNSDASARVSLCDCIHDHGACGVSALVLPGNGACVFVDRRLGHLLVQNARGGGAHTLSGGLSGWRDCVMTSVWGCLFESCGGVCESCCRNRRRGGGGGHGRGRGFESPATAAVCGLSSRLLVE